MRKTVSALIVFLTLLTSTIVGVQTVIAPYTSDGQVFPLAGPISIKSPTNVTYNSNKLILNVTSKFLLSPKYANLCYSLDGTSNVTIPLTGTQEPREVTRTYANGTSVIVNSTLNVPYIINGEIALPELSEGKHTIIVYANYYANDIIGLDESRVYFTIDTNSEKMTSIPEFPDTTPHTSESFPTTWIAAAIGIIAIGVAAFLVYFAKIKKTTGKVEK